MPTPTVWKLLPLSLPFAVMFVGGFTLALLQSLGFFLPVPHHGGPLDAYTALLRADMLQSAFFSVYVAAVSATLSVCAGAVLAHGIWRLPARMQQASLVYKIPLILPHIAVAFIVLVFWTRTGFVSSLLFQAGGIDSPSEFPSLLYGGNGLGMILAYMLKETPFMIILGVAALRRLDPRLVQTAQMYGASEATIFRTISLPQLKPVLHTVFIILFLYTFGAFDIPWLLGESRPAMLSIEAYNLYFRRELADRSTAMALLVLMFLFSTAFIAAYAKVAAKLEGRVRKI